ncbi:unnamed protein product, partial [Mesorhabditis spiculigera]
MQITVSSSPLSLEEKEEQLRNRLLAKTRQRLEEPDAKVRPSRDDEAEEEEDVELFQVQPKEKRVERPRITYTDRDRDRKDKERSKVREKDHDRRERSAERRRAEHTKHGSRHSDRRLGERPRSDRRHEDREGFIAKHRKREKEKEKERGRDKERRDRDKEKDKDRKRTKRSRTKSPGEADDEKRPKLEEVVDKIEIKDDPQFANRSPSYEQVDEEMGDAEQRDTDDEKARKPGYSKFDSDSENEDEKRGYGDFDSPGRSPVILRDSDDDLVTAQDIEDEDEQDEEFAFDPTLIPFDELTDEQKARLSPFTLKDLETRWQKTLIRQLPIYYAGIMGCRNVREYDCMNKVEEGTFGVVYRAKCRRTEEVVALKRLKMEKERDGFPITSLREINMLLKSGSHPNIVNVREIVIGDNVDKIFLVMEFVEHDLKSLMDTMKRRNKFFEVGHVKTLLKQLLSGLDHMHNLWILHRDLKTSNLLMTHNGILKIADFGLAREYGDPLEPYTEIVVTLWYRAPELLLGAKLYSTPIDMWSVGCIMAEFIRLKPLWAGSGEPDQLRKIFMDCGTPQVDKWPGIEQLENWKKLQFEHFPYNQLRKKFDSQMLNQTAWELLNSMLTYNPDKRYTATQALKSAWFKEEPLPIPSEQFPTFPAKSEGGRGPPKKVEPEAPRGHVELDENTKDLLAGLNIPMKAAASSSGFALKFDKTRF